MHRSSSGAALPPKLVWPPPANTVSEAYPTGGARGALGSGVSPKGSSLSLVAGPEESSVKNHKTLATVLRRVCAALISAGSRFTFGCGASTCRSYVGGYGTGAIIPCVVVSSVGRSSHKGIDGAAPVVVCEGTTGRASSTCEEADRFSPRATGVSSTECSGISSKDGGTASEPLGSRTKVTPGGAGASAPSSELLGSVAV